MAHWISNYVGKPYIKGKQDCWTVFCDIQNNVYNKNLELINFGNIGEIAARNQFQKHQLRQRFKEIKMPVEGCAVFLGKGKYTSHIGVFLNSGEGKVIHAIENTGIIIQTISELEIHGWRIMGYYEVI